MKTLKITFVLLLVALFFTSCGDDYHDEVSLDNVLESNDVWYIDYNKTVGTGDVRFMSLAFTLSFENGIVYANNNLVDIGIIGDGFGDAIGDYNTYGHDVTIQHDIDGGFNFEVIQVSGNRIKLRDHNHNVTYTLNGYSVSNFDYDGVFYDNIEYFLQEYGAWEKSATIGGVTNTFDDENFLAFIPTQINKFNSSKDIIGTNLANLIWDFNGKYEIFDVQGIDNLKVLTLNYDDPDNEEFELRVIDDGTISMYHHNSDTTYEFNGRESIVYKKGVSTKETRKRFKVTRKTITKKQHITKISNR